MALTTAQKLAIEKMKEPKIAALKKELAFMKGDTHRRRLVTDPIAAGTPGVTKSESK